MQERTIQALNALNRCFYDGRSQAFDATRRRPWPGWARLRQLDAFPARPRVLDLGCGNGRFLEFLRETGVRASAYHGLDACQPLLELAAARQPSMATMEAMATTKASPGGPVPPSWRRHDFVAESLPRFEAPFDLVVLFGVLHHVPGEATRRRLLEECAERVAPSGLLVVSFWRFRRSERLVRHQVSWEEAAIPDLDRADLEAGDVLLTFGAGGTEPGRGPLRYCHDVAGDEQRRLLRTLPLTVLDCYESDGKTRRLNQYVVMRREP